jgi:hypothetical protein
MNRQAAGRLQAGALLEPFSGGDHLGRELTQPVRVRVVDDFLGVELHDEDQLAGGVDVLVSAHREVWPEVGAGMFPGLPIGPAGEVVDGVARVAV